MNPATAEANTLFNSTVHYTLHRAGIIATVGVPYHGGLAMMLNLLCGMVLDQALRQGYYAVLGRGRNCWMY